MLARDLVGWDVIAGYDELVLANDSCFLLRPLGDVFETMNARACDWWGLQATAMEFNHDDLDDPAAQMSLEEAKRRLVGPRRWNDVNYLHLSSYLLVFRAPVIADRGFRYRLDTVVGQRTKELVVHKYEVGLSRYLMDVAFEFDTWVEALYPFHPLYSRRFFELVHAGFPSVKRNFLAENPRFVPDFAQWPEWLTAAAPEALMDVMLSNIARVSPPARAPEEVGGRPRRAHRQDGAPVAALPGLRLPMDGRRAAQVPTLVGLSSVLGDPLARPRHPRGLRGG